MLPHGPQFNQLADASVIAERGVWPHAMKHPIRTPSLAAAGRRPSSNEFVSELPLRTPYRPLAKMTAVLSGAKLRQRLALGRSFLSGSEFRRADEATTRLITVRKECD